MRVALVHYSSHSVYAKEVSWQKISSETEHFALENGRMFVHVVDMLMRDLEFPVATMETSARSRVQDAMITSCTRERALYSVITVVAQSDLPHRVVKNMAAPVDYR